MQAGASHLADGIESADRGLPVHIRHHPAALVVSRGDDRDGLLLAIQPEAQEFLVDEGEALAHEARRLLVRG